MRDQAYYRLLDGSDNNLRRDDRELAVNCCGLLASQQPFHTHNPVGRSDFYLQYLVAGEMEVWQGDGEERLLMSPGQAVISPPHTPYRYAPPFHSGEVRYYWIHFSGSRAEELVAQCGLPGGSLLSPGLDESLERLYNELFQTFLRRDNCSEDLAAAHLTAILVTLGRRAADRAGEGGDRRITRALAHIHSHYADPLTVESLAALEHLSASRFRTVFRDSTGLSPRDYITVLRLNHARQLMAQTELTIGEIAAQVGYPDQLYFSRVFSGRFDCSPTKYRQKKR